MVMMAEAMRVTVSLAPACAKDEGLGLAGAVPVPAGDVPAFPDLAGHALVAVVPEADRGQDRADGAGMGQVTGPDREPGAAPFPRGHGAESGVEGDTAGQPGGGGPGGEFLRHQVPGEQERSIGPVPGPAPRSGAFASRSAVSDPSHR